MGLDSFLGDAVVYDKDSGEFVSSKVQRIAEIISEYDPNLRLVWIPKADRVEGSGLKPFGIMHHAPGHEPYMVVTLEEEDVDERVLATLYHANQSVNNAETWLACMETAARDLKHKEQEDRRLEARDKALTLLNTPLHTFRMGKGKVYHL